MLLSKQRLAENSIILADLIAYSSMWFSPYEVIRGSTISNILNSSQSTSINEDTPTRIPPLQHGQRQHPTSPDVTIVPILCARNITWRTETKLSSDHIQIITKIAIKQNQTIGPRKHSSTTEIRRRLPSSLRTGWLTSPQTMYTYFAEE